LLIILFFAKFALELLLPVMSLNYKHKLYPVAKELSKELRKKSTVAETILWKELKARKFFNTKFLRQHPIFYDITGNESFFIADFYCHEKQFVIELDGMYHQYRLAEDRFRTEILKSLGLQVIRFSNNDILYSLDDVLKRIEKKIV
jgi:very-short-patch-repair endonuclease